MTASSPPPLFTVKRGNNPLLISMPHVGTYIPPEIAATMTPEAAFVADCDWHLEQLYGFAERIGATVLAATHARYVIDLNRPPDDASLYPGLDITGLIPLETFDRVPLYLEGQQPVEADHAKRRTAYWRPYHDALERELAVLKMQNHEVLLWEAHSIRSQVPRLFEGTLPDFNIGTADGASALPGLAADLEAVIDWHGGYSAVENQRFKGGYITRQYGRPEQGVHAVQLELSQATYMDETRPYRYDETRAAEVSTLLEALVQTAMARIATG
ncbi:N-formylglutamate deformylase [Paraburkholderia bonniea]|uniref:N-formylglutamate deformylase n=1 Tax=Paraburkholderia bonniea TaxID=2152891 RepID=UPI0012928116|nr:N-formylglutamate deformylase [Paraburkholderia bonniea]WJF88903.1 N-formylglutamate deformylase [Paraburkholderia bonniea]WJF92219.1 N-formylglutamate deformylase [Paraburkholderia bonniea]